MIVTNNCSLVVWCRVMWEVVAGSTSLVFQGLFVCQGLCKRRKPIGNRQQRAASGPEWEPEAGFPLGGTG